MRERGNALLASKGREKTVDRPWLPEHKPRALRSLQALCPPETKSQVTPAHTKNLGWYLEFEFRVTHLSAREDGQVGPGFHHRMQVALGRELGGCRTTRGMRSPAASVGPQYIIVYTRGGAPLTAVDDGRYTEGVAGRRDRLAVRKGLGSCGGKGAAQDCCERLLLHNDKTVTILLHSAAVP